MPVALVKIGKDVLVEGILEVAAIDADLQRSCPARAATSGMASAAAPGRAIGEHRTAADARLQRLLILTLRRSASQVSGAILSTSPVVQANAMPRRTPTLQRRSTRCGGQQHRQSSPERQRQPFGRRPHP